jgi:hypothetical protein
LGYKQAVECTCGALVTEGQNHEHRPGLIVSWKDIEHIKMAEAIESLSKRVVYLEQRNKALDDLVRGFICSR